MIPKIIHFCWLSGETYPETIKNCLNSWKEKLFDYEIIIWDTKRFDVNSVRWTREAFSAKKYAFAADYIRFYALYNYGGIYLDSDVEVVESFDEFLENKCFFGFEYTAMPEAAVIGCEKGLNWCKRALSFYEKRSFVNQDGSYNQIIAPLVLKYAFESEYKLPLIDENKIISYSDIKIYPFDYFSPKNGFTGKVLKSINTHTIHHFNSAWLKKGLKTSLKRKIHLLLIAVLGKKNYNKFLYKIRGKISER